MKLANHEEKALCWLGGGGGGGAPSRSVKELPSQIVNEVVIWGLLIQNSLPGKNAIRIETVAILVYFYKDKPLLFLILQKVNVKICKRN